MTVCGMRAARHEEGMAPKRLETEAGEGTRTLDLRLGKPTLYQLSYAREAI